MFAKIKIVDAAREVDEPSIAVGDRIVVTEKVDADYWEGHHLHNYPAMGAAPAADAERYRELPRAEMRRTRTRVQMRICSSQRKA